MAVVTTTVATAATTIATAVTTVANAATTAAKARQNHSSHCLCYMHVSPVFRLMNIQPNFYPWSIHKGMDLVVMVNVKPKKNKTRVRTWINGIGEADRNEHNDGGVDNWAHFVKV